MSLSTIIDALVMAGCTPEQIAAAVRADERERLDAANAKLEHKREANADRQRRHRERNASNALSRVTDVNNALPPVPPCLDKENPPTPPKEINPNPPLPPIHLVPKSKTKPKKSVDRVAYPPEFELVFDEYGEKARSSKHESFGLWRKLSPLDQDWLLDSIGPYNEFLEQERQRGFDRTKCGFQVFIRRRQWEGLAKEPDYGHHRDGNTASLP